MDLMFITGGRGAYPGVGMGVKKNFFSDFEICMSRGIAWGAGACSRENKK